MGVRLSRWSTVVRGGVTKGLWRWTLRRGAYLRRRLLNANMAIQTAAAGRDIIRPHGRDARPFPSSGSGSARAGWPSGVEAKASASAAASVMNFETPAS